MISEIQEEHAKYVAAKATNTPYDLSDFEFHRGSTLFIGDSCSTNIDDGADGSARLLLFERCPETIGAGIAMQTEWSRLVENSVPIGEDKYRRSCEFRKWGANGFFHRGSKAERGFVFE